MTNKIKIFAAVAAAAVLTVLAVFLFFTLSSSSSLTSLLPEPSDKKPYLLIETRESTYPKALSALMTDGIYALLRDGTPRNTLLSAAENAVDASVLIEEEEDEMAEVYAALRFSSSETKSLKNGEVPESIKVALKSPKITASAEKDVWLLSETGTEGFVIYFVKGDKVVMAAGETPFKRLRAVMAKDEKSAKIKWRDEKKWPSHIELSDGGRFTSSKGKDASPLKIQAAWHKTDAKKPSEAAGELRWSIEGLDKLLGRQVLSALSSREWDTSKCVLPDPLLLSMGINLPELKGMPKDWPFPLSTIGALGETMDLSDREIRKILSGQTILSLGGHNKILWFALPGFMAEFTGGKDEMRRLVDSFWEKLFFGAKPKPMKDFDYGGTTTLPFSVVGAARDNTAVLGLISPESIRVHNKLGKFLKNNESAIGWLAADLPRIGAALSSMTKMNSFMNDEAFQDDTGDEYIGADETTEEVFQPEMSFSPFDQEITDSFGNVLRKFGSVVIIWEKAESGRMTWFNSDAKAK